MSNQSCIPTIKGLDGPVKRPTPDPTFRKFPIFDPNMCSACSGSGAILHRICFTCKGTGKTDNRIIL